MKKIILLLLFILFAFSGCSENEKMNLAVFIDSYNLYSENEIDFTSFTGHIAASNTEYSFIIENGEEKIMVKHTIGFIGISSDFETFLFDIKSKSKQEK